MIAKQSRIAIGTRFKMSALGALRCPRLAEKVGTIVGMSRYNTGVTVLFDGKKTATCLHKDYISPVQALDDAVPHRGEQITEAP